jgi:hypothetical protein
VADIWDPFGTIGKTLWITGAQWAGKSTVARILAATYGVTAYHYDYAFVHAHRDRALAERVLAGGAAAHPTPEWTWVSRTPKEMAAELLQRFTANFEWVLDDLRALVSGRPIVAEGWGLRPEVVAPILDSPRRMLVMVPTEEFRQYQLRTLPRASAFDHDVSDPELGQRNRVERDRLLAVDVVDSARRHGIRVLEVDGSLDAEQVAAEVAEQFAPYLPT